MQLTKDVFGELADGRAVERYALSNDRGLTVRVMTYGATILAVETPDRRGRIDKVTLGMSSLAEYEQGHPCFGSVVGRYANRIARGRFTLDGITYSLATNNHGHHLHGGQIGFDKRLWTAEPFQNDREVGVRLSYASPDGEEGYPGTLDVTITYLLSEDNRLAMLYTATTDRPTVVNLTNHAFWNLAGAASGDVLAHEVVLHARQYLPVDEEFIPLGPSESVKGTPLDFTTPRTIGSRIAQTPGGYDHCLLLEKRPGELLSPAARVVEPTSGRVMEVFTTEPGVQFYTGNGLDGGPRSGGFPRHGGLCLEAQHYPDSPNRPEYPSTVLRPGETYRQSTVHAFL